MRKFVIERTKGNEEVVIRSFENFDEAKAFGMEYAADLPRRMGIVTLAERDLDEFGQPASNVERVFCVWH